MISVIIPCYNCAQFIERAVLSVLSQTIKNLEIILVDNNSTDDTFSKLLELQKKTPEIIQVYSEVTKGAPTARNKGLSEAKGKYIQFLDADDELKPSKLESQYLIAESTGADIVIGNHVLQYNVKNEVKTHVKYSNTNTWEGLISSNLGITSSNLWNKASLLKVGGWDTTLTSSQEYDLLFRLLKIGAKFEFDKAVETVIHKSDSTISTSANKKKLEEIITNRINLRTRIKTYLEQKDTLTPKLKKMVDTYIFTELMDKFNYIPEFAADYLNNNDLDISKNMIIKTQIKRFLKNISFLR